MKRIYVIIAIITIATLLLVGCQKVEVGDKIIIPAGTRLSSDLIPTTPDGCEVKSNTFSEISDVQEVKLGASGDSFLFVFISTEGCAGWTTYSNINN